MLVVILGVVSALPLILRHAMLRVAILLPAAAGVGFTLLAIATRLADDTLGGKRWLALLCWLLVAGGAAYAATVCEMSALRTRAATLVVPLTVSGRVRASHRRGAARAVGAASVVVGVAPDPRRAASR